MFDHYHNLCFIPDLHVSKGKDHCHRLASLEYIYKSFIYTCTKEYLLLVMKKPANNHM